MSSAPTGMVSFLFSDVEGSTRLWEQDHDAMAASLALHDETLRAAIDAHRGHVFSTAGDAFAVAFHSIEEAVNAAIEIQRNLLSTDWPGPPLKVRMGIHTGDAQERDGDYFGPVLNRAARIMSAGHGGQILLSSVTAEAAPVQLHDLGTHHLKDLDRPEHVFEVRHPDLPVVDRPIRTVDVRRHNLPEYLTSFVGRERELESIHSLLGDNRLVVLTGVGGTGKTRIAVEAARSIAGESPDGAWLVELAAVSNPGLIMTAIGEVWGLRPGEGATIEDVVIRYLWGRTLTLVVDNCEHVLGASSRAIKLLLDSCPRISILATSRESLGIPGEVNVPLPSLSLPDATHPNGRSEAVRLFMDRASVALPHWVPSAEEMEAVARICTRIDGIPLGLELAAARLRTMTASDLADRLDGSFRILSRSAKTALPRQRTLHATIDWSYDLLAEDERALFRRLAMFLGGFDLPAVEGVASGAVVNESEVVDLVDSLVDKSLVVPSRGEHHGTRFRLLEPVRQYAQEKLAEAGESEAIAAAHARYFADLVARLSPLTRGPAQMPTERHLETEYDNIRAAFQALIEAGDAERALTMGFDLFLFWQHLGMQIEGRQVLLDALAAATEDADRSTRLKAWCSAALLGAEITDPDGIPHGRRAVALAETMDDPNALGRAHLSLAAVIRHSTTDPEYLEHLELARDLLEAHPEPHWYEPDWDVAMVHLILAAYSPVEEPRKAEYFERAIEGFEKVGDQALLAATLADTGSLWGQVDNDTLLANMRRAVDILESIEVPYWLGHAKQALGSFLNATEDFEEAGQMLAEARLLLQDCGDLNCWAGSTRGLSHAETGLGRYSESAMNIAEVLESMPVLPLREFHVPYTLDQVARILEVAGEYERCAIALGNAMTVELPADALFGREMHEPLEEALVEALGEAKTKRLMADGAAMATEDAFVTFRQWLLEAAGEPA